MRQRYRYAWPREPLEQSARWTTEGDFWNRELPESAEELSRDSRWPAFFPSPLSLVTTTDGKHTGLEKVVGASIVNRFPYLLALSFCRDSLSARHYSRHSFMELLERGGTVAVQFLPLGPDLDRTMQVIGTTDESETYRRLALTDLPTRQAQTNRCPVFAGAYLVYEARLVRPSTDFEGVSIHSQPWIDAGSHRLYFLEITAIQLRADVARGTSQVHWRSLPDWTPSHKQGQSAVRPLSGVAYQKGFTADYAFPSANTIAFEADAWCDGMAIKHLPPLPTDQVEVDNDRARWPCFFPSSVGMITSRDDGGPANLMPCGSTTVISRHPLIIAPAVSYAAINARYAPRSSLDTIRRTGCFGCGVPYRNDGVLGAIRYAGNVSLRTDPEKIRNSGLEVVSSDGSPRLANLPVHFDCEVVEEVRLGTHSLFFGEARRLHVRKDVTPDNPMVWCPWADVVPVGSEVKCA